MKKITGIMLAVVMLVSVLAVSALAANAPLTAAEALLAVADKNFGEAEGTVTFKSVEPILPWLNATVKAKDGAESTNYVVDYSNNTFDVAVYIEDLGYLGSEMHLFYNPGIVKPTFLAGSTVYELKNGRNTVEKSLEAFTTELYGVDYYYTVASGFTYATDLATVYESFYKGEADQAAVDESYNDGEVTYVFASASGVIADEAYYYETYRWPFEIVAEDNNWYRTKLVGVLPTGVNNLENIPVYPTLNDVVYVENDDYTGPKFDIVGAMKRNDGELRFGSVYFSGVDAAHDNETTVLDAGVVLYPSELLSGDLTLETEGAVKISAAGYYDNSTANIVYTGVLTGLNGYEDMYITARSFVKYMDGDNEVVVYSDPIARSLEWVGSNTEMK